MSEAARDTDTTDSAGVSVNRGDEVVIGLDVGGTKVLGIALDAQRRVVDRDRRPTPSGPDALIDVLAAAVASLAASAMQRGQRVVGVGVGVPGLVTAEGIMRFAPNLPGVRDLPVGALLSQRTGLQVAVDNDNTCATLAEWLVGPTASDMVYVGLGTGIGGGLVVNGRLARGAHGFAGEIGHMCVAADGPRCVCGRRGCWEVFASGHALGRLARERAASGGLEHVVALAGSTDLIRGEHVRDAAASGDAHAREVVQEFAGWVALGLIDLVNILDPALVVLGGGMFDLTSDHRAAAFMCDVVRTQVVALLHNGRHRPVPEIRHAALGSEAGAVGAAQMLDEVAGRIR